MGTRHLVMVVAEGQIKVANYGQWDGYITGQGITALKFLRDKMNHELFTQKALACTWITPEEHDAIMVSCGAEPKSEWISMDVSNRVKEGFPHLHRDCGANILEYVQDSKNGLKLADSTTFAGDSLFCEWAYVVDMDKNMFEVYSGYSKEPLVASDRFYFLQEEGNEYSPEKLIKSYSLDNLPTNEQFIEDFSDSEEE